MERANLIILALTLKRFAQNHKISMVHTHSAVSQCWDWVHRFNFPPARLSTLKLCVYACVRVWVGGSVNFSSADTDLSAPYLHMRTMWLTAIPYLFRLATSPHACMHTHSHAGLHTSASHSHVFTRSHTNRNVCSQGEMMKGNSKPHSQLKTLWNSVCYSVSLAVGL